MENFVVTTVTTAINLQQFANKATLRYSTHKSSSGLEFWMEDTEPLNGWDLISLYPVKGFKDSSVILRCNASPVEHCSLL